MSFSVYLYIITDPEKKITKTIPTGREITGVLFQDVEDINSPVLELDKSVFQSPNPTVPQFFTANYAYIPTFGKYYFITGKTIVDNDHPVLYLREDVLKTYQAAITGTTAWIERSASAGSWMLPDGLVPMSSEVDETRYDTTFQPFDLSPDSDDPSYVVTTAGGLIATPTSAAAPDKYLKSTFLSPATSVFRFALSRDNTLKLADIISSNAYVQHWFDDLQSGVFSLMAFPFEIDHTSTDLAGIQIGSTIVSVGGYPLKKAYHEKDLKATLGSNALIATPSDFRIASGDYVIRIFLPFVGWQTLEPEVFADRKYLNVNYKTNLLSGTGVCTVYAVNGASAPSVAADIVAQYEYVAGLEIPITINTSIEVTKNAINTAMSSLLAVAGAVVTENPALIGGAITSGLVSMTRALTTPVKTGSLGSSSFSNNPLYQQKVLLQYRKRKSPVLDTETAKTSFKNIHGLRTDAALQISSLTGYFKCRNWWMDPPTGITETELKEIENHMESGVIK